MKKLPPQAILIPDLMWEVAQARADREFKTPEVVLIDAIYQVLSKDIEERRTAKMPRPAASEQPQAARELPGDIERTKPGRGTGFKGVYPHGKRYRAVYAGSSLGVFDTPEEAALERYTAIRGELEGVKAEQEEKFAASSDAVAREEAANLQKFLDSAPRIRIGNGDSQVAPLEVTPEMEARIKAHVAAGRMSWPAGLAARDEKRAARAAREAPASASASARPADAPPLEDSADPEVAEIEDRVRRGGLQLFDTTKA